MGNMKRFIALILGSAIILTAFSACSSKKKAKKADTGETAAATAADTAADTSEATGQTAEQTETTDDSKYILGEEIKVGQTWTVDGLWEVTITSVKETRARDSKALTNPAAVYDIAYTVKNVGYKGDVMEGLYVNLTGAVIDSKGEAGYVYTDTSIDLLKTPVPVKQGETGEFLTAIGLDNAGLPVKLVVRQLGTDQQMHEATFVIDKAD
ncbi:MAG: hypothetical protein IJT91_04310 [Clostridia bacterium]|nr:hypothetical protein [Clostridia bacterium]